MEMEEEKLEPLIVSAGRRKRWCLRVYIVLQTTAVVLVFVCINYRDWIQYCWFQFGVQSADNISIKESDFQQNINYLHYLLCQNNSLYAEKSDVHCPGFCGNLQNLVYAGGVMLFFMLYCVMLGAIAVVLHVIKHFRERFTASMMLVLMISPSVSLLIGGIVYLSITDFAGYEKTNSVGLCEADQTVDFRLSTGALLWLILLIVQLSATVFGAMYTNKEFKKT